MGFGWYYDEVERHEKAAKDRVLSAPDTRERLIALADEHDHMNHWEWSRMVLATLLMYKDEVDEG